MQNIFATCRCGKVDAIGLREIRPETAVILPNERTQSALIKLSVTQKGAIFQLTAYKGIFLLLLREEKAKAVSNRAYADFNSCSTIERYAVSYSLSVYRVVRYT